MTKILSRHIALLLNRTTLWLLLLTVFAAQPAHAQISIGGKVFGGARQADVGGSATVVIGADHFDLVLDAVYGGNDISGTIGASADVPTEFQHAADNGITPKTGETNAGKNINGYGTFVRVNPEASGKHIFIGQLFAGGYGDYVYTLITGGPGKGKYKVTEIKEKPSDPEVVVADSVDNMPEVGKAYMELCGGTYGYVYGGGDNVTVNEATNICIDNQSTEITKASTSTATDSEAGVLVTSTRLRRMGINTAYYDNSYQFARVFGGNNKAPMAIQPTWHLWKGSINSLYSGGNAGDMTSPTGLLLILNHPDITVNNVYGGCRMATVNPDNHDIPAIAGTTDLNESYSFPAGFAAKTIISDGDINNVYGGNDVSGNVRGGNAVGIRSSIKGNVYGGGNGSYPYTDNANLKEEYKQLYGDFYYNVNEVLQKNGVTFTSDKLRSAQALNLFRPNAEQVSVRVAGTVDKPTIIHGAVYCGGNSATLMSEEANPKIELKIGSYAYIDNVFLGNNGENMVKNTAPDDILNIMNSTDKTTDDSKFNSMDLTVSSVFAKYMEGAAMKKMPAVKFDGDDETDLLTYDKYTSYIGSFYCGGNVGSSIMNGKTSISFHHELIVYDKVVGGCNNANIDAKDGVNAAYEGGMLGNPDTDGTKVELTFNGIKIQPKRWNATQTALEWNTFDVKTGNPVGLPEDATTPTPENPVTSTNADLDRRLVGGNVYGGCYNTGHVNGNVVINVNATIHDRKGQYAIFDQVEQNEGEAILYAQNTYKITERKSGVILDKQGMDPLGLALNVFGGGYGPESEIWGSTHININAGYVFQVFGGGQMGAIGKPADGTGSTYTFHYKKDDADKTRDYKYNSRYSCYINLKGEYPGTFRGDDDETNNNNDGVKDHDNMAESEFIYGGAYEGLIAGNTQINLGNGRIFNCFTGSCNADILGHTETYIGRAGVRADGNDDEGFPWVRDHVYGANDLGGRILGEEGAEFDFSNRVKQVNGNTTVANVYNPKNKTVPDLLKASVYMEYRQGRVDYIFGGCYGDYDYTDPHYSDYTYTTGASDTTDDNKGTARDGFTKPRVGSVFVNFCPTDHSRNAVSRIYGAGQGHPGDSDRDIMQDRSYVLIDDQHASTAYLNTDVFGAGDYSGVGMRNNDITNDPLLPALNPKVAWTNADSVTASTVIDLLGGEMKDVYGGSYKEGVTRRTIINVPAASTIVLNRIFGGSLGIANDRPCDVYEANINYASSNAVMKGYWIDEDLDDDGNLKSGGIYGGNNAFRRTLYSRINISSPVVQNASNGYSAKVFGAGYGANTWAQYTEVNLKDHASVYEVYGGGYGGMVLNKYSVEKWQQDVGAASLPLDLGNGYNDLGLYVAPAAVDATDAEKKAVKDKQDELASLIKVNGLDELTNTNVYINKGSKVWGYCYGGGLGADATVSGTTYIGLHGGTVAKDLYAGGWGGGVFDKYKVAKDANPDNNFVATANAYIEGGMVRNCYGGGYQGSVGYHEGALEATNANDIYGQTNVVIGIRQDQDLTSYLSELPDDTLYFHKGLPAVQRNAYGAGEGGAVYGTAHLTLNNGYIGYAYLRANEMFDNDGNIVINPSPASTAVDRFEPKLDDETWYEVSKRKNRLKDCGNLFGAGYDDKSSCDSTHITIWGGTVRSSVYGGGEIATVGRAKTTALTGLDRGLEDIYKYGKTHIEMYNGHVRRNVFGGGKGYNILGFGGTNELYTDGYVFGQTEVYIHGGEIGTVAGIAEGYGNVFGGGDVGFVYGNGYFNSASHAEGTTSPNHYYYYSGDENQYRCTTAYDGHEVGDIISKTAYEALSETNQDKWKKNIDLTEDCKVVVSPYLQVRPDTFFTANDGTEYPAYSYVPTDYLNYLPKKNANKQYDGEWLNLLTGAKDIDGNINPDDPVERGVIIHNAVFAGGNVSSNSDKTYANATTVYGNTTATLYDVYHRDFISVGTEHMGGIYGGGNLSVVDGYRELNITNYGTDYYGQNEQITLDEYRKLSNRERAYFQLKYLCVQECKDKNDKTHYPQEKITEEDYNNLFDTQYRNENYWVQYGFCSIYAGRLLNTIQRADLCGVYGSRMVLQGAKDRVADVGDNTEYTINRVGEVSLNQQHSLLSTDTEDDAVHGNYFGIYSLVNYMGNLTSDVDFNDTYRKWDKTTEKGVTVPGETYEEHKVNNLKKKERNKGVSYNQVALASGVFLELTTENSTKTNKQYGYVTGVIELDLINVKKDIEGGGYVYAKNEHGFRTHHPDYQNVILSEYNKGKKVGDVDVRIEARTYKRYTYSEAEADLKEYQTSGNFIHKRKTIVDDCYPKNGIYKDGYVESPAHYWYIKGDVYIYDQLISAYAGSATAYHKEVKIPLTITAGSNGKLKLLDVQPSLYAYKDENGAKIGVDGVKVDNESATYHLNDVITWWDWHQLSPAEQDYFVKETYVNVDTCTVDGVRYAEGQYVMLPTDSESFTTDYINTGKVLGKDGSLVTKFSDLFHPSNNISHNTGYVLTFDMDSPSDWDDWYSLISGTSSYTVDNNTGEVTTNRKKKDDYNESTDAETYRVGPTFTLGDGNDEGLYGQRYYTTGEIISKEVYDDYTTTISLMSEPPSGQASVDEAYVAKTECMVGSTLVQEGHAVAKADVTEELASNFGVGYVCINTIQFGKEDYILQGELVGDWMITDLAAQYMTYNNSLTNTDPVDDTQALKYVEDHLSKAYCCTSDGKYGGQYFRRGINYSALKSWCSLTDDRDKFDFNYDAFDVLADTTYSGNTSLYARPYCDEKPVDYTAYYAGDLGYVYKDKDGTSHTISTDAQRTLSREAFEKVQNEQQYFTRLSVPVGGADFYIVKENFFDGGTPFAKGQDISLTDFSNLSEAHKLLVNEPIHIDNDTGSALTVYYCYESGGPYAVGDILHIGDYKKLNNYQKHFSVLGAEPTETTTLYVSRESNAKDVTSEKVITVVYQYTYYDDDEGDEESGISSNDEGISLKNELHVVNIRLKLESGVPEIGQLSTPPTILPGKKFGLKAPTVNPGLYEIISNGWEMYTDEHDAETHINGVPFTNNSTPVYWYQNQKTWVAFYSRTYLGKTYSNPVKLSVANYHDLDAVMNDKKYHLHVDHPDVMRNSKIYIDNRACESDPTKSELDLLKDFYDLSLRVREEGVTVDDIIKKAGDPFEGHTLLNNRVKGGANLDFILSSNVSPKKYVATTAAPAGTGWTPIGDDTQCFAGTFHGDGHTVSGLDHSLFGKLCGNVYNLGVTGSFTSAGVADSGGGRVENCWINTTGNIPEGTTVKAVFDGDDGTLVNSYYPVTKTYAAGAARAMTEREFYNGTVAYNLNGFYLNKRYYDGIKQSTGDQYNYLKNDNGTLSEQLLTAHYATGTKAYVESRYENEDFIYSGGTVPETNDMRLRLVTTQVNNVSATTATYAPIWPDDYIFFGQKLTYDPLAGNHQEWPTRIVKSGGLVDISPSSPLSNRVCRAPAYFRSSEMGVAHFNINAVVAAKSKPKSPTDTDLRDAYPNMTAIDFAGHNDLQSSASYKQGLHDGLFYQPLLDDDGLGSINTNGQTPNLLVYAPAEVAASEGAYANKKTHNVLNAYFAKEPQYSDYDETAYTDGFNYNRVAPADASKVVGHLVQSDLTATNDHLLVDKQEFYCPIAYDFNNQSRMWYQRMPDEDDDDDDDHDYYVDRQSGWETVSLPFEVEVVTTNTKGELTHFYQGSTKGHEYWLREYNGKQSETTTTFTAKFESLAEATETTEGEMTKEVQNTFLWDFFYEGLHNQQDDHTDEYRDYYKDEERTYPKYPRMAAGTPYLIGFPGATYYEFDLSGTFQALTTASGRPDTLTVSRQMITFASNEEAHVNCSDQDTGKSEDGYHFKTSYLSQSLTGDNWVLNAKNNAGKSSFDKTPATPAVSVLPFRPYFTPATAGSRTRSISRIDIGSDSVIGIDDNDPSEGQVDGQLTFYAKPHKLGVTSSLRKAVDVRIFGVSGLCVASFTIQPGQTVETNIPIAGVYIVRAANGRYNKKVAVK